MGKPSGGTFIGLDIGTQTIKFAELRGAGSRIQISALGIENTPPGLVLQGDIVDPKALATAIKSMLSKYGGSSKKCVSAVAGTAGVVVRVIDIPRMTAAELAETMKWEVERHIPFSPNDVETSYQAIDDGAGADPNNPNMEVLLAVVQRDIVSRHLDAVMGAGLNPTAIDIEDLAVGRSLINLQPGGLANKNVVVVNIGASNTEVGIFKNGILRFPRSIPLAGDNLTNAIAMNLGLSMEAAEDEKRQHAKVLLEYAGGNVGGSPFDASPEPTPAAATPFDIPMNTPFSEPVPPSPFDINPPAPDATSSFDVTPSAGASAFDPDNPFGSPSPASSETSALATPVADDPIARRQREIFDAMLPILGELSMELRRSIDYFRSKYPNDTVDQIVLCGGSAVIPNLAPFMEGDLGIPAIIGDPFAGTALTAKQMSPERIREIAPVFAVAVGLAARDAVLGS